MRLAIIGTRGIPNNYGGFETLVEFLVDYLAKDIEITVFCSSIDLPGKMNEYKGAKLRYIPITSHGSKGILYDSISLLLAVKNYDKILLLGFGGGFIIPLLKKYKNKIILNIGGLDWKRDKWSIGAQKAIKLASKLLINNSGQIISDNLGIQKYIKEEYNRSSSFIAYGGDQAQKKTITPETLAEYPFLSSKYAFIVTRIQSDNNIEMMLNAFSKQNIIPFVMVGNWNNSEYGKKIRSKYSNQSNIILLDAIYDRDRLNVLRSNCTFYIHGHSAGGTNPSLVEAMFSGLPIFAFASGYNENTTYNKAMYFKDENELLQLITNYEKLDIKNMGEILKELADIHYLWSQIAEEYKNLILNT